VGNHAPPNHVLTLQHRLVLRLSHGDGRRGPATTWHAAGRAGRAVWQSLVLERPAPAGHPEVVGRALRPVFATLRRGKPPAQRMRHAVFFFWRVGPSPRRSGYGRTGGLQPDHGGGKAEAEIVYGTGIWRIFTGQSLSHVVTCDR